jgi:hypothetical protein
MEVLVKKNTGNFYPEKVLFFVIYQNYYNYLGSGASGDEVEVELDPKQDDDESTIKRWFTRAIKGDKDVEDVLVSAGYDKYTNLSRPSRLLSCSIKL